MIRRKKREAYLIKLLTGIVHLLSIADPAIWKYAVRKKYSEALFVGQEKRTTIYGGYL
jgi:hypothetical protein